VSVGLRTLCLAVVNINPKFYADWNRQYQIASSSIDNRQQLIEQAAERIEKVCLSSVICEQLMLITAATEVTFLTVSDGLSFTGLLTNRRQWAVMLGWVT